MLNKRKSFIILCCLSMTLVGHWQTTAQTTIRMDHPTFVEKVVNKEDLERTTESFIEENMDGNDIDTFKNDETAYDEEANSEVKVTEDENILEEEPIEEKIMSAEQDLFGWSGVHAEIERSTETSLHGNVSVRIETANEQAQEGVVLAHSPIKPNTDYEYTVYMKGKGTVFLKVEETNLRGHFLKETASKPVTLSNDWKEMKLQVKTEDQTAQVDLFILTTQQEQALFFADKVQFNELP